MVGPKVLLAEINCRCYLLVKLLSFYFAYNVECYVIIIVASWLETIPCVFCNKVYLIEFGIKMKFSILVLCIYYCPAG
jgi:hypothetical protein